MDLHVLPGRMKLISVKRADIPSLTHHLIKLILFPESCVLSCIVPYLI